MSNKTYLEQLREKTRMENSRKMDDITFRELLDAGEIGLILMDGGVDLTTRQLEMVKEKAKEQAEQKMLESQYAEAAKPGYRESQLGPVIKKLMESARFQFGPSFGKNQQAEPTKPVASEMKSDEGVRSSSPVVDEKTKQSASVYRKTGSKMANIIKTKQSETDSINESMTNAGYLGEIYKLMVKNQEDIKLERQQQLNLREEEDLEDQKRHNEIIKALTVRRKPAPKKVKAKQDSGMPKMPGLPGKTPAPSKSPAPAASKPPAPTTTPGKPPAPTTAPAASKPSAPAPAPAPAPARPPAPASSATPAKVPSTRPPATAQRQPTSPAPPATATPAPPVSIPPSAVIVGAGALASTSAVLGAIKGAEGGGNYDITFGDVKMKDGTLQNRLRDPKTKEFLNLKTPEQWSQETLGKKKKLTEMKLSEVLEFQRYRSKAWPSSGAAGSYGIMPSVLFGQDFKTKASGGLVRRLGYSMDTIFDKETQDKLVLPLFEDNLTYLKKNGVPTTPGWAYMSWYIGMGGAVAIWKALQKGDGDKKVGEILSDAKINWAPNANPELGAEKFNGGMKNTGSNFPVLLEGRLVKKGGLHMTPLENTGSPANPLNESSTTNRDLRSQSNPGDQRRQTTNNVNINNVNGSTPPNSPIVDDRPAHKRK